MKIDLNQLIFALSDTVDLVGVDEVQHGKRVGYMAWECAKTLGYTKERQKELFYLGLLHDCGVSSTRVHKKLVNELEWKDSQLHCELGAKRMAGFGPLAHFADGIFHHHTRWSNLKDMAIPDQTRIDSNLIFLVDRVDALAASYSDRRWLIIKDDICGKIDRFRGEYFQTDLVDAFLENSRKESFWFTLEPSHLKIFLNQREKEKKGTVIDASKLHDMAALFAQIVDAKSPYTAKHSAGVAQLAGYLAKEISLPEKTCHKVQVAGLLHDLGKLQVPDAVLEKKGRLDAEDLSYMRHHSYVSYAILRKIEGIENIALWAANHHEALDGSGYPFHKTAAEIDLESSIIMVADIFQALAQNRPYRPARPEKAIVSHLLDASAKGTLNKDVVNLVVENKERCYQAATSSE